MDEAVNEDEAMNNFVDDLVDNVPELGALYEEHLAFHHEPLAHVFMGDVTRFVVKMAVRKDQRADEILQTILEHMESGLRAQDLYTRNLVIVSFVENLIGEHESIERLRSGFGPRLRRWAQEICEE